MTDQRPQSGAGSIAWPDKSGVFGYRKVDGHNTRFGWFCRRCKTGDDDLLTRRYATHYYRVHRRNCALPTRDKV